MGENHEVARIRRVYRNYQHDDVKWAQWSPSVPGNRAITDERSRLVHQLLVEAGLLPLTDRRVLDVGCGNGNELARLVGWGAAPEHLYGVDLLDDVVCAAREQHPDLRIETGNAERLRFPDESFDLVLLFTVLSSVLDDEMAGNIGAEVRRVLVPDGVVAWYDIRYPNPRNRAVRSMRRAEIEALFPGFAIRLVPTTLMPAIARRLGRFTSTWYPRLARVRLLQTHYVGLLRKPHGGDLDAARTWPRTRNGGPAEAEPPIDPPRCSGREVSRGSVTVVWGHCSWAPMSQALAWGRVAPL